MKLKIEEQIKSIQLKDDLLIGNSKYSSYGVGNSKLGKLNVLKVGGYYGI